MSHHYYEDVEISYSSDINPKKAEPCKSLVFPLDTPEQTKAWIKTLTTEQLKEFQDSVIQPYVDFLEKEAKVLQREREKAIFAILKKLGTSRILVPEECRGSKYIDAKHSFSPSNAISKPTDLLLTSLYLKTSHIISRVSSSDPNALQLKLVIEVHWKQKLALNTTLPAQTFYLDLLAPTVPLTLLQELTTYDFELVESKFTNATIIALS